ncbi:MAG: hypothetical protein HY904_15390 [Deltaproteobacteria bacterium]|nr:hypothetical protein [Deltaproteobacteria bacterium]
MRNLRTFTSWVVLGTAVLAGSNLACSGPRCAGNPGDCPDSYSCVDGRCTAPDASGSSSSSSSSGGSGGASSSLSGSSGGASSSGPAPSSSGGAIACTPGASIRLSPAAFIGGNAVAENGGRATFSVCVGQAPVADVAVLLQSQSPRLVAEPALLVFTPEDWNTPQNADVVGVDDSRVNESTEATATLTATIISDDAAFAGAPARTLAVEMVDDEHREVRFQVVGTPSVVEGASVELDVRLGAAPASGTSVEIQLAGVDSGGIAVPDLSVAPATLVFTPGDYNELRRITVSAAQDDLAEAAQSLQVRARVGDANTDDPLWDEVADAFQPLAVSDDDPAEFVTVGADALSLVENPAQSVSFGVHLRSRPGGTVNVALSIPTAGALGTLAGTTLVFTPADWDQDQPVTIHGVAEDGNNSPNLPFDVVGTASGDVQFSGATFTVAVSSVEDDVKDLQLTITGGAALLEGETRTLTITPTLAPSAGVTVQVSSASPVLTVNGGASASASIASGSTSPATLTLSAPDDAVVRPAEDVVLQVVVTSADPEYQGLAPAVPVIRVSDRDQPELVINVASNPLPVPETGGIATFTVALARQPTDEVVLIGSFTAGAVPQASTTSFPLTFTTADWNVPRTVTLTGLDDAIDDDGAAFQLQIRPDPTTVDPVYATLAEVAVNLTSSANDDTAGVTASQATVLVNEAHTKADSFTVRLTSQPLQAVHCTLAPSIQGAVSLQTVSVDFTPANWSSARTVSVQGIADANPVGGNRTATIAVDCEDANGGYSVSAAVTATVVGDFRLVLTTNPLASGAFTLTAADNACRAEFASSRAFVYHSATRALDRSWIVQDWATYRYMDSRDTYRAIWQVNGTGGITVLDALTSVSTPYWTGLTTVILRGLEGSDNCLDWASSSSGRNGKAGNGNSSTVGQLGGTNIPCNASTLRLLCVGQ